MDPIVLDIADAVQFFVEDTAIAASVGLERRVHQMTKHPASPVLQNTLPCEGPHLGAVRVLWDEEAGLWRMWYKSGLALHVAVSPDGVSWEKPALGVFPLDGHADTNVSAFADGSPIPEAGAVFHDPDDPDPARRYKLIDYRPNYYLSYSPDGITWTPAQAEPVWPNGAGDGLEETKFFMRDELSGKYRGYMRVWQRHQTIRTTSLGESDDLLQWSGPKIIWQAGPEFGVGHRKDDVLFGRDIGVPGKTNLRMEL